MIYLWIIHGLDDDLCPTVPYVSCQRAPRLSDYPRRLVHTHVFSDKLHARSFLELFRYKLGRDELVGGGCGTAFTVRELVPRTTLPEVRRVTFVRSPVHSVTRPSCRLGLLCHLSVSFHLKVSGLVILSLLVQEGC